MTTSFLVIVLGQVKEEKNSNQVLAFLLSIYKYRIYVIFSPGKEAYILCKRKHTDECIIWRSKKKYEPAF
jgi:hypothetical protein